VFWNGFGADGSVVVKITPRLTEGFQVFGQISDMEMVSPFTASNQVKSE